MGDNDMDRVVPLSRQDDFKAADEGKNLSAGTGGVDEVDQLSGSGLDRRPREMPSGDMGADEEETARLAQDARELLREDHQNRDVPRGGNL